MEFNHLFWAHQRVPHGCWVLEMTGIEDDFEIDYGIEQKDDFGENATFEMDPDWANDTLTPDHLNNIQGYILVSERLCDFLRAKELPSVQYLPVTVKNHKGRPLKPPYFLVHPTGTVDCIDLAASGVEYGRLAKTEIQKFTELVIDPAKAAALRPLCRLKHLSRYVAVERSLVQAMEAAGFTGNGFVPASKMAGNNLMGSLNRYTVD
jgi:hypothetical protein